MVKAIALGVLAFMLSFFVADSVVHGQTATPITSPTMTTAPSPTGTTTGTTVPAGAPATGFGE
jgi:hypothetical protein